MIGNNAEVEVDVEIEVEAVALPDNATLSRRRRLVAPGTARTCNLHPATCNPPQERARAIKLSQ